MGYKNYEKRKEYQRQWIANKRTEYFKNKYCINCGSTENLELDHIDPDSRTKSSQGIWSMSKEKMNEELKRCQVLCHDCHVDKTQDQRRREMRHGTSQKYRQGCHCDLCKAAWAQYKQLQKL